ncbi:response regulator [Flagellimonas sp.]|uniref:response regulator n=1 Tax=Flagellimonas sp. TaxID=2058762 RepID=UPI003F4A4781
MRVLLLLFFLALLSNRSYSQKQYAIDSLRHIINTSSNDSIVIEAYLGFYDLYKNSDLDSVKYYLKEGLSHTLKKEDLKNHAYLTTFIAWCDNQQGNYKEAHAILDESLELVQGKPSYLSSELRLLNWKSIVLQSQREIDSAHTILTKIARLSDDFPIEQVRANLILGNIELRKLFFQRALHYYHQVDSVCQANQLDNSACTSAVANSGLVLMEIGQLDEALRYLERAKQRFHYTNDKVGALSITDDIARIHLKMGNLDLAEEILVKRNALLKEKKSKRLEVQGLKVLNKVYRKKSNFEKAESTLERGLALSTEIKDTISVAELSIDYGKFHTEIGNYNRAKSITDEILELLDTSQQIERLDKYYQLEYRADVYEILVSIALGNENYKRAFKLNGEMQEIKDQLTASKDARNIKEVEEQYQNEKKQQEIELLTSQSQLAAQKSKNERNLLVGGLLVLGLAFGTLFFLFRNKQKTNKRLRELEAAKSKFFANISHEFRTPLTLITGPVSHLLSQKDLSADNKTDLGLIQRNANRLLKYVNQILDLSKIEAGSRKLRVSEGDITLFLNHLIEPFQYQAVQKGIKFHANINLKNEAWFDRDIVEKITTNLLSNALKYNRDDGDIAFVAQQKDGEMIIKVTNANHNLTEKELPFLFERFYQNNTIHQGFGIGLSLVQELTSLSHGTVRAFKPNLQTIAFEVILPNERNAFSKNEIVEEVDELPIFDNRNDEDVLQRITTDAELEESASPVLLVVDDNAEIRLFIKTLLKKEYQILEAENGEEGMQIALKSVPDLIISDVMMPVRDGISMSNALKNDERTSHVPIVLLTAKSGEENELTGLKTGADAYIVKPFKEDKLRVVIEKLIATRTAMQEKFGKQSMGTLKGPSLTKVDTKLMERIQQILDVELTNPEFNASYFSEQVGLSRMHLHRKLKALTGFSTSEFIRSQRLKLAATLLKEGHTNIAEIGYAVGFNQPAYFSTAFKQHFGCAPSQYIEIQV